MSLSNVIVFGAGNIGRILTYLLRCKNIRVVACFDNNEDMSGKELWQGFFCSRPILIDKNLPVFISVQNQEARDEIRKQCSELGYINIVDVDSSALYQYIDSLPDEEFVKMQYFRVMGGKILDLENPQTFNEKLQWLKLYDHNPKYTAMVDKYEVKKYVSDMIGEEYVIPTFGVWDNFEDIDFGKLPDQFVLKCTHDSGSVVIVTDKSKIDYQIVKEKLERALRTNFYEIGREWMYKDVRPRIIAEQYLIDESQKKRGSLFDYKVHCFNGVPTYIQVIGNRNYHTHSGFQMVFDFDWKEQSWSFGDYPKYEVKIPKPIALRELYHLCEMLCKEHRYIRLDFYIVKEQILFGEITFIPASGYYLYNDDWKRETDLMLGNKIILES